MAPLLLKNIRAAVTCRDDERVLEHVDILCDEGLIRAIGSGLPARQAQVLDCTDLICYPGLVNTHHHLYQCFSRNLPQVQGLELFPWLRALYEIWKNLDRQVVRYASLTAMG